MEEKTIVTREITYDFFLNQTAEKQLFVLQNLDR